VCNFFRRQSADLAQRHRGLCICGKRRMAADEDQPQHVVLDWFHVANLRFCAIRIEAVLDVLQRGVEAGPPPEVIDRLEATGRDQPGDRIVGHAVDRPRPRGCCKGVVQRLFRPVEIAEQADQRRQNPARMLPVDIFDHLFPNHLFQGPALTAAG